MPLACASYRKGCERTILSDTRTTQFATINSTHDKQSQRRLLVMGQHRYDQMVHSNNTPERQRVQSKIDTFK